MAAITSQPDWHATHVTFDACGQQIVSDDSAVDIASGGSATWRPFVGDIRSTPTRLIHARCFVRERDVDEFISLVAAHSMRQQSEIFRLLDRT